MQGRDRDAATSVSVILTTDDGEAQQCSAELHRDSGYMNWNRMVLIGTREDWRRVLRVHNIQTVRWAVFEPPRNGPDVPPHDTTEGLAAFRSMGAGAGAWITDGGVEAFAELELYEVRQRNHGWKVETPSVEFSFLQRPLGWPAHSRRRLGREGFDAFGDWHAVKGAGVSFRLVQHSWIRNDPRVSQEAELIEIPAVELRPMGMADEKAFLEDVNHHWFSFRILISFVFRQYVSVVSELRRTQGVYDRRWLPVALEARPKQEGYDDTLTGPIDRFFTKGLETLGRYRPQRELLHAASYGYVGSFIASTTETRLTNCVEALERLVSAFEAAEGLDRYLATPSQWRRISKALREAVRAQGLDRALDARVQRSVSDRVGMTLQERVERMARAQLRRWTKQNAALLAGLTGLIKARNDIVHGRLIEDINLVHAETLRARAIFERLFLNLIGYRGLEPSSWVHTALGELAWQRGRGTDKTPSSPPAT